MTEREWRNRLTAQLATVDQLLARARFTSEYCRRASDLLRSSDGLQLELRVLQKRIENLLPRDTLGK
jgi:hypothetical protein